MLKIGITGGIGSGKTTVCKIFEAIGVPIYYADDRAKQLMTTNKKLIAKIIELFGKEAYLPSGELNRVFIANIVFKEKSKLNSLNSVVHPAVFEDGEQWFLSQKDKPYALKEAALLVESKGYLQLDKLIVVTAPKELRIQRVMERDHISREKVLERIKNQLPESEKLQYADFIIYNENQSSLVKQVLSIHKKIISNL